MKIVQVMGGRKHGGAELYFERLTIALANSGENILPIIGANPDRTNRLTAAGLATYELNFGGSFDFITRWKMKKLLNEFKPKVVFAWMNRAAHHTPKGDWILVGRLGGYYNLKYYQHCDHLVGNTQLIVDWIINQGWPKSRVHYLPNFSTDFKSERTSNLHTPARIFSAGRLHVNKGFDTLIRAIKYLPNAQLSIAGEGPERKSLEDLIKFEGLEHRVQLLGWSNNLQQQLAESDVFVCPSRHEPLGNVIIEAFSAEIPVIATMSDGASTLIVHEQNGLLAPVDDVEALAKQIQRCLEDSSLRTKLVETARIEFENKYSEQPVIECWKNFITKLEKV